MMRLTFGGLILLGVLATGCTTPSYENNHWHINHVAPRMAYHFGGYRQSTDGTYFDKLGNDADDVVLTLERHFLNYNPQNPLVPVPAPKPYRPQPPNVPFEVKNP
jgi:hypothetical protein